MRAIAPPSGTNNLVFPAGWECSQQDGFGPSDPAKRPPFEPDITERDISHVHGMNVASRAVGRVRWVCFKFDGLAPKGPDLPTPVNKVSPPSTDECC